jgi:hypothetical protein
MLLGAGVAVWFLWWGSRPTAPAAEDRPMVKGMLGSPGGIYLSRPDPGQACTIVGVNNSGSSIESVVLKFSTQAAPSSTHVPPGASGGHLSFGNTGGEFRPAGPLKPGERTEYFVIVATGSLESVAVGSGEQAKTHAVATPLAGGKKLIISYEPDGKLSTRTE